MTYCSEKNVIRLIAVCVLAVLVLGGCAGQFAGDTAAITINFGNGAGRAVDDEIWQQISFIVELSGPSTFTVPVEPGTRTVNLSVVPGSYVITVTALLDGNEYAKGTGSAQARAGQKTPVTITLSYVGSQTGEEYTVTFDTGEGGPAVAPQTVTQGGTATRPPADPAKDGFAFDGWYADANFTALYDFSAPVNGNIILYAKWLPRYTVTFMSNGGSDVAPQNVTQGDTATHPLTPTRAGYGFVHWCSDETLLTEYHFDTPVTSDITLYAKWSTDIHTVTFIDSSGATSPEPQQVGHGGEASAPNVSRTGYTGAWYKEGNFINLWDFDNDTVTASITLYVKWTANTWYVAFNANGGSGTMRNQTFTYDTAQNLTANTYTRSGHTFAGWAASAGGAKVYDDGQSVSNLTAAANGTVTLYAVWVPAVGIEIKYE